MIRKIKQFGGTHRTGSIQNATVELISRKIGIKPSKVESGDGKVTRSWWFSVDGERFAIWDYKGSAKFGQFSFYGQRDVMMKIFGSENIDR